MKVLYDDINISVGETGIESAPPGCLGVLAGDRGFYAMFGREVVPLSAISRCVIGATGSFLTGDPESLLVNNGVTATVLLRNECYTIVDNPPGITLTFLVEPKAGSSRCTWLRMNTEFPGMAHLPKGLLWTSKAGEPTIPCSMPFEVAVYDDMARFAVYNKETFTLHCIDELEVSMLCGDGTDGKGGVYTLSAVMVSGVVRNGVCSWSSSDESIATVVNGEVRAVEGAAGSVDITATSGGISSSCRVTVYSTLPDVDDRYRLPGGSGLEMKSSVSTPTVVFNSAGSTVAFDQITYGIELNSVTNGEVPRMSLPYCRSIIHSAVPTYMTNWHAIPPAWVYSPGYYTAHLMLLAYNSEYQKRLAFKRFYTATSGYGHETYAACYTTEKSVNFDGALTADTGATINDEEYVNQWSESGSLSRRAGLALLFYQQTRKFVHQSWSRTKPTMGQLLDPRFCELYYTPQNYILYRNRTAGGVQRANYTVIPNAGTLGRAYDLSANNVPAGWFGV